MTSLFIHVNGVKVEIKTRNGFSMQDISLGGYGWIWAGPIKGGEEATDSRARDRDYLLQPPFGLLLWSIRKIPLSGNAKMITVSKCWEKLGPLQKYTSLLLLNFEDEHSKNCILILPRQSAYRNHRICLAIDHMLWRITTEVNVEKEEVCLAVYNELGTHSQTLRIRGGGRALKLPKKMRFVSRQTYPSVPYLREHKFENQF